MLTSKTRHHLIAAAAAAALLLSGCGGNETDTAGSDAAQGAGDISAEHNDADVTFINDMTPHHDGAVAMSDLAADRADSDEVKELAEEISSAQEPELEQMQAMAKAWNVELSASGGGHGGGHGGGMGNDAGALEPLSGSEFDREFLTRMIAHHEGALPMAQAELDEGSNPSAKELATDIVEVQKAEIAKMKELLTQL
jgi:uncharacterized protein (DUF305 family)